MVTHQSLAFLNDEDVIAHFNDLLDLDPHETDTTEAGIAVDDTAVRIRKLDASTLSLTDVLGELERRGLQPKGFYSDDCRLLQRCYDDEHEEYGETKRKELREAKVAEAERKRERYKVQVMEATISEEKEAILSDPRLSEWFQLILAKAGPLDCRIAVNNITARSLAKVLYTDDRIKSIDVSNMGLSDKAGAYLARALANNKTLAKLEMDGNDFGPETCRTLASSLITNASLKSLSLGSNLLTKGLDGEEDRDCVEQLATAIAKNSVICLSLWRCGIGLEGGKAVCTAVSSNTKLISVEVGNNDFDNDSILLMHQQLEANRKARELKLAKEAELAAERERALQEKERAEQARLKDEQDRQWLEEQKALRAEARRLELERQQEETRKEEERRMQLEKARQQEEERVKAASKKSKKGRKGKGKKK